MCTLGQHAQPSAPPGRNKKRRPEECRLLTPWYNYRPWGTAVHVLPAILCSLVQGHARAAHWRNRHATVGILIACADACYGATSTKQWVSRLCVLVPLTRNRHHALPELGALRVHSRLRAVQRRSVALRPPSVRRSGWDVAGPVLGRPRRVRLRRGGWRVATDVVATATRRGGCVRSRCGRARYGAASACRSERRPREVGVRAAAAAAAAAVSADRASPRRRCCLASR
eukprot:365994-Chlamydomonas_euryale.AAC.12